MCLVLSLIYSFIYLVQELLYTQIVFIIFIRCKFQFIGFDIIDRWLWKRFWNIGFHVYLFIYFFLFVICLLLSDFVYLFIHSLFHHHNRSLFIYLYNWIPKYEIFYDFLWSRGDPLCIRMKTKKKQNIRRIHEFRY